MRVTILFGLLLIVSCGSKLGFESTFEGSDSGEGNISDDKLSDSTKNDVLVIKEICFDNILFRGNDINVIIRDVNNKLMNTSELAPYIDNDFFLKFQGKYNLKFTNSPILADGLNVYLIHYVARQDKVIMEKNYEYFYGADDFHLRNFSHPTRLMRRYKKNICKRDQACRDFPQFFGEGDIASSISGFVTYQDSQITNAYCFTSKFPKQTNAHTNLEKIGILGEFRKSKYEQELNECFLRSTGFIAPLDKYMVSDSILQNKLFKKYGKFQVDKIIWPKGLADLPECMNGD